MPKRNGGYQKVKKDTYEFLMSTLVESVYVGGGAGGTTGTQVPFTYLKRLYYQGYSKRQNGRGFCKRHTGKGYRKRHTGKSYIINGIVKVILETGSR